MNILMMTNTYLPQVGGVARSVASFTEEFRRRGHRVLVVAPTYTDLPETETDVYRVPAIPNFNGSEFSLTLPVPVAMSSTFDEFGPDIVHAHHPFSLGDTALRVAALRKLPLVFTHHTMYEQYTHYLPATSDTVKNFAVHLPTGYANLCDHVIAPSDSIARLLRERGVTTPISAIPTGIDPGRFALGQGGRARGKYQIPEDAFVVGHVGRLAPEKNLGYLAQGVALFLSRQNHAHFLLVGSGPAEADVRAAFTEAGVLDRLHLTGSLQGQDLADVYQAMNVFVFASQSETQGMVLAEAMTAGVPVVALDAPGARDVLVDGEAGRLLPAEATQQQFAGALEELADSPARLRAFADGARAVSEQFSLERCATRLLGVYEELRGRDPRQREVDDGVWDRLVRVLEAEWDLWNTRFEAAFRAINDSL